MNFLRLATAILLLGTSPLSFADKAKEDIWVFGDSLTSLSYSWAEIIDDYGFAQMRNTARGGLRMVDVTMPDWLVCGSDSTRNYDQVIIWLGSNDAFGAVNMGQYRRKLTDHLQFLQGRGCTVWVILPPTFEGGALAGRTELYRIVTERISKNYDNVTVLDMPFAVEHTLDGVHQNEGLMFWNAVYIVNELGLTPPE